MKQVKMRGNLSSLIVSEAHFGFKKARHCIGRRLGPLEVVRSLNLGHQVENFNLKSAIRL